MAGKGLRRGYFHYQVAGHIKSRAQLLGLSISEKSLPPTVQSPCLSVCMGWDRSIEENQPGDRKEPFYTGKSRVFSPKKERTICQIYGLDNFGVTSAHPLWPRLLRNVTKMN